MTHRFPSSTLDPRPIPSEVVPLLRLEPAPWSSPGLLILAGPAGSVRPAQLAAELTARFGSQRAVVCSNSLRLSVEPDLYLWVRGSEDPPDEAPWAESAAVPDGVVEVGSTGALLGPDSIGVLHDRWVLRRRATAIVLAGGLSSRLGVNKALLPMRSGKPLIQCVVQQLAHLVEHLIVSTNEPGTFGFLGVPLVPDEVRGEGPLMGVASALKHSPDSLNLVVSCDMPFVPPEAVTFLFRHLGDADGVLLVTSDGRYHPLFALYRSRVQEAARAALAAGRRRVVGMAQFGARLKFVEAPAALKLHNLNTPEDLASWSGNEGRGFC